MAPGKNVSFFIFAAMIFFLVVPAAQAAVNYPLLKNEYIRDHPGQALIPYPWDPETSTRVLPFDYEIPAAPGTSLSITACRNEYEPASFIVSARKDLPGITVSVPDLHGPEGDTIPSSTLDVRLVKVWYQAGEKNIWYITPDHILTPELLVRDDALVYVDYLNMTTYLKVTVDGTEHYIDISSPEATVPPDAEIHDAGMLQPFSLKAHENKQIWLTVHVPDTTPAGDYYGNITVTAPSEDPVTMNLSVTVLPFDLEPAPVEYGLYYTGTLTGSSSYYTTPAQYTLELQDMKEHGVVYPTLYQEDDGNLDTALALRDTVGLPRDTIYIWGASPGQDAYIGNASDPAGLETIADTVVKWRNHTETHGYTNTCFYGMDEATGDTLVSQRAAWQTVHDNGGKMFVAVDTDAVDSVGDLLDVAVLYGVHNTTQVTEWHGLGKKVFSYGNPQVGIENPEIYRTNYGFTLWNDGYDGAMDFAYQDRYGQSIWNDYDAPIFGTIYHYRDHVFAYPTNNGVIDTIQWEGWREGVDDTRYAATLIKKEGNDTSARSIVSAGLSGNETMTAIRKKVIGQILSPHPPAPPPTLTLTPTLTQTPASVPTFTPTLPQTTMESAGTPPVVIVALFGLAVYAVRFRRG